MEAGSISGVYKALLFGLVISSMDMEGIFKSGLPKSTGNVFLKQS